MSKKTMALAAGMLLFGVACAETETEDMGEMDDMNDMPAAEEPMTQPAPPITTDTMGADTMMTDTGMTM